MTMRRAMRQMSASAERSGAGQGEACPIQAATKPAPAS